MTEIQKKINFVAQLSDAITMVQGNVDKVEYEVYAEPTTGATQEFLVITYAGGAISARNCNMNSCSAIFRELADKMDHGYYDEVDWYKQIAGSWNRIYAGFIK